MIVSWNWLTEYLRLDMPVDQIESVIRLVQSNLDASVIRYLKES